MNAQYLDNYRHHNMFVSRLDLSFKGSQDDDPRQREEAAGLLPNDWTPLGARGRQVDGGRTMDSIRPKRGTNKPVLC